MLPQLAVITADFTEMVTTSRAPVSQQKSQSCDLLEHGAKYALLVQGEAISDRHGERGVSDRITAIEWGGIKSL